MCVVCALCVSVLWHSRTSALSHLADTALPTPVRSLTGSHWSTAPYVPRCTTSAFCVVPHCLVLCTTLHCVCPAALLLWAGGSGQWNSCNALPHCLGAVGSGPPAIHCPTAWGQWAVQFLQCTASLPGGSGQCNSYNTLPHCLGAAGSGPPSIHRLTAWGQWAVDLLQYTAALPGGSGQWVWCGVVWCGVVWCGVVWCGVVWCGVVWCGVVWCGVAGMPSKQVMPNRRVVCLTACCGLCVAHL